MNFTREPIIETIISAKEGYKLSIKSSKGVEGQEYLVDAVEVVSFGGTFFYRCQERPKTFFIPASDFEIAEIKETRILIKNPSIEKAIKIAGGKDASKSQKVDSAAESKNEKESPATEQKRDKKRGRRTRNNKQQDVQPTTGQETPKQSSDAKQTSTALLEDKAKVPPPIPQGLEQEQKSMIFSHLLTPPPVLISESLNKYKQEMSAPETLTMEEEKKEKKLKSSKNVSKGSKETAKSETKEKDQTKSKTLPPVPKEESRELASDQSSLPKSSADVEGNVPADTAEEKLTVTESPKPHEAFEEKEITTEPFSK